MIKELAERLNLSEKEVSEIEKEQADVVFNRKILTSIIIVLAVSVATQFFYKVPVMIFGFIIAVILLIIGIFLYNKEKNEFSAIVKELIIKGLFEENFSKVIYQPEKGFSVDFIKKTGLYPIGNVFESDDLLTATYKNVGFMQSDVLIQQVTSNGKTTTTTTLFKGRWIVCDFIKNFDGYHQIRLNNFFKNKKPFKFFNDKLAEFKFENKQFNEKFTTYTSDQQEAYYLINPGYMEKIEALVEYINKEVVFGFKDNKLHVAIFNNEDAFEVKNVNINENFVKDIENDIYLIKLIIDALDLELDIFK